MNFFENGKHLIHTTAGILSLLGWAVFVALRYLALAVVVAIGVVLAAVGGAVALMVMAVGAICILLEQVYFELFPEDGTWGRFWEAYRIMRNRREHALEAGFPGLQKDAGRIEALRIAFRNTFAPRTSVTVKKGQK